uniref:Regulator of Vps4 activity in the MVB pathway protein n=1 Tax=Zea mays TaxID=4577 RepID=A0A804MIB8_MAIZE
MGIRGGGPNARRWRAPSLIFWLSLSWLVNCLGRQSRAIYGGYPAPRAALKVAMVIGRWPARSAKDAEKLNRKLHVDLISAQARVAALESREVIAVEALKQAKDEHVQKLMEAYLVTHNQRRALRIQEPASSNPVQPIRAQDPQILEGHPVSIRGEKKAWELPEGAIVLEGIPVFPQAMDKQEHPESSQHPPPELFELLTMKKIPAPSLEVKEEAASTPPAPPPSEELQEPIPLEEEFNPVLPSQSPPEEVINISSLLTHPGDVSD